MNRYKSQFVESSHYVLKIGGKYCRFGSYSTITLCDDAPAATLYTLEAVARKRLNETGFYCGGNPVEPGSLKLVKITLRVIQEDVIHE